MEIFERSVDEILKIELPDVEFNALFNIFSVHTNRTIYVIEHEKIIGIITLGNLKRNFFNKASLITEKFIFVNSENEYEAFNIMKNRSNINSIPVLDNQKHIIKEYYVEREREDTFFLEMLNILCGYAEIVKRQYKKIFVLTGVLKSEERAELHKIQEKYNHTIVIREGVGTVEIKRYTQEKIFVYDYNLAIRSLREQLYKDNNIDYVFIDGWREKEVDLEKRIRHIKDLTILYRDIAIFDIDENIWNTGSRAENISLVLKLEYLTYNSEVNIYQYNEKISDEIKIEVVFIPVCPLESALILINGKLVPIISDWYIKENLYSVRTDFDIVLNIIPQLKKMGVKVLTVSNPNNEVDKIINKNIVNIMKERIGRKEIFFDILYQDEKYAERLLNENKLLAQNYKDGYIQRTDMKGEYYNVIAGERITYANPKEYKNTLYLFGYCVVFGYYVEDNYTISSFLREKVDKRFYLKNLGAEAFSTNFKMRESTFMTGDIAIIFLYSKEIVEYLGENIYSLIHVFNQIPNIENHILDELVHCDDTVMERIADDLYQVCMGNQMFSEFPFKGEKKRIDFRYKRRAKELPHELKVWLDTVKREKSLKGGKAGAIVMNCNPFTKGHFYLIKEARKEVDILYVFVLEEDRSFFKFSDRFEMVKLGVAEMDGVIVIPSGRFIISSATLPGYFEKEDKPTIGFDATMDLEIFSQVIAKEFEISIRFAGTEPNDVFTKQYNQYMSKILPQNGVEFREIDRLENEEGQVISASLVRKCMKNKEYEKIKKLVVPIIYEFLKEHYFE